MNEKTNHIENIKGIIIQKHGNFYWMSTFVYEASKQNKLSKLGQGPNNTIKEIDKYSNKIHLLKNGGSIYLKFFWWS